MSLCDRRYSERVRSAIVDSLAAGNEQAVLEYGRCVVGRSVSPTSISAGAIRAICPFHWHKQRAACVLRDVRGARDIRGARDVSNADRVHNLVQFPGNQGREVVPGGGVGRLREVGAVHRQ